MKRISLLLFALLVASPVLATGFGAAMPAGDALDIGVAISTADAGERSGKFSGRIVQVCQKEGCWLVIESNGAMARVRTKDHAFVVPKDSQGTATVYGVLSPVQLDAKEAEHLSDDGGGAAVAPREWQIVASAIVIEP